MSCLIRFFLFCFVVNCNVSWFAKDLSTIGREEFDFDRLVLESSKRRSLYEFGTDISVNLTEAENDKALEFISRNENYKSYFLLMALRKNNSDLYKSIGKSSRIKILCSSLKEIKYMNDWGYLLPGYGFDGEAAKALLECGKEAIPYLKPILDDNGMAELLGSEEADLSIAYSCRRKDFAFKAINSLSGKQYVLKKTTIERDEVIDKFKKDNTKAEK